MQSKSKNIVFAAVLLLLFGLSYARDTLFILINAGIDGKEFNYANMELPPYIKQLSAPDLVRFKWLMAAVFSFLFMLITMGAIEFYFRERQYTRLTGVIYLILGVLAVTVGLLDHIFTLSHRFYAVLHFAETIIQSPLVLLLLFSVYMLALRKTE